jgi:hypothetical protein
MMGKQHHFDPFFMFLIIDKLGFFKLVNSVSFMTLFGGRISVTQAVLQLAILLPPSPECCDYRYESPHQLSVVTTPFLGSGEGLLLIGYPEFCKNNSLTGYGGAHL